ncbi:Arrestin domain-containing protein 3 [Tyrophagus putrescentiae]|nr:Arrestin domain-containing protein 3 [Tyrophagus putrescentiae]
MGKLKHFEIIFHSENDVYYPGDVVRGKVQLELRNELKIRTVKVSMRGVARVHWTEAQNSTSNLAIYTEHINSELEYFFEKKTLFDSDSSACQSDVFGKGRHDFEFSFQLPTSGLTTSFEGKYGNVRYWVKAEIEKPWSFDYRTKKAFTLISPIDINRPEYLIPLEKSKEKTFCCLWCTPGHISVYAKTERTGYCPGESILINAEFENHTRRTVVPQATLHQTQLFLAAGGKVRSRSAKFTTVTGVAVQPHKTATWDGQLLKIPPISPSILNCRLIRVEYTMRISLNIPPVGYKCFVDLPIIVGTVPFHRTSSSSLSSTSISSGGHSATSPLIASSTSTPLSLGAVSRTGQQRPYLSQQLRSLTTTAAVDGRSPTAAGDDRARSNATPPPTYAECINGSVDIDDEDEEIIGNTRFTPRYTYVNNRNFCPPPAYSEVDPYPESSRSNTQT